MQITSWANKRILITGTRGFIGSHLLEYFTSKKATILGVSRGGHRGDNEIGLDVTDYKKLATVVKKFKPNAFFHLASEALVESGQSDPYRTFHNNIIGALNVLEICRIERIQRIIIASSVHVYGNSPLPYREDEPARPSRPYETSKASIDLIAQSYADSFNLPVLIPRFVNIYGPGDTNKTRIIPKTIDALIRGGRPTLWAGGATRDYLYIDDAIHAYDLLGKISDTQIERNRIFNFATGHQVSAKTVIDMIVTMMDKSVSVKKIQDVREHELEKQDVVWIKAKNVLGWQPTVDLMSGLKPTIAWYLSR